MTPVEIALWFVEASLGRAVSLAEVARQSGVSRFHLSRAFGATTGVSLMRYARGRRLSEAARVLADGAGDILSVALDAGYGSHEAFTRAFREQFGRTPEAVRAGRRLDGITLVEALRMDESLDVAVAPPRFENGRLLQIAGLGERYNFESAVGIPALWARLQAMGCVPGQVGPVAYGVCSGVGSGHFDYLAGVEVEDLEVLPREFARVRLPPRRYAVFTHAGHVSGMRATMHSIWNRYLPESGLGVLRVPEFERYGPEFDPGTGLGGVEIWIPVQG